MLLLLGLVRSSNDIEKMCIKNFEKEMRAGHIMLTPTVEFCGFS